MTQYTIHKNTAVSPVIGVMLLLIMTVLLVAIVSSYAGSLTETREKFPQLIINPEIYKVGNVVHMNIDVLSAGAGIPTRDIRIITEWESGVNSVSGGDATIYPMGRGAGMPDGDETAEFGDYILLGGTLMYVEDEPGCEALFGSDWTKLAENDLVTLRIIHIPSQTTIAHHEILVRGV